MPAERWMARASSARQELIIGVAVSPRLSDLARGNHRMMALLVVCRGVPIRGIVTAADLAAAQTDPQVHPPTANFQTFFTPWGRPMKGLRGAFCDVFAGMREVDPIARVHIVLLCLACNRTWGAKPQGLVPFPSCPALAKRVVSALSLCRLGFAAGGPVPREASRRRLRASRFVRGALRAPPTLVRSALGADWRTNRDAA